MTAPQKQLILDRGFLGSYEKSIAGKVNATLEKLIKDPTTNGLHVEPIQNCADDRVRTARVTSSTDSCSSTWARCGCSTACTRTTTHTRWRPRPTRG